MRCNSSSGSKYWRAPSSSASSSWQSWWLSLETGSPGVGITTANAAAYSFGVVCLLLLYPVLFAFTGPESIKGSPQSTTFLDRFGTDLNFAVQSSSLSWNVVALPKGINNSVYLGLPLIIVLACFTVFFHRRREILVAGAMMLIAFVLSLGSTLSIDGHTTWLSLPFALFTHLPALSGYEARRFALFTDLFAAAVIAIGVDELWKRVQRPPNRMLVRGWPKALGLVAVGAVLVALILPLVPRSAQVTSQAKIPAFFTSSAVDSIQSGGTVLAFPYSDADTNAPLLLYIQPTVDSIMLDQAVSNMRFNLIGGFGWFPSPSGNSGVYYPAQLEPRSVQALFDIGYVGGRPPSGVIGDVRTFLRKYDVQAVLVVLPAPASFHIRRDPGVVVKDLTAAIGKPEQRDGVTAWLDVGQRLPAAQRRVRS